MVNIDISVLLHIVTEPNSNIILFKYIIIIIDINFHY